MGLAPTEALLWKVILKMHRVRELDLKDSGWYDGDVAFRIFGKVPAPLLQKFKLEYESAPGFTAIPTLSDDMFNNLAIKYPAIQHIVARPLETKLDSGQRYKMLCEVTNHLPIRHMRIMTQVDPESETCFCKSKTGACYYRIQFLKRNWEEPALEPPPGVPDVCFDLEISELWKYVRDFLDAALISSHLADGMKHVLSALETLDIDVQQDQDAYTSWSMAFSGLENLTAIRIKCTHSMRSFLHALCSTLTEAPPPSGGDALLEISSACPGNTMHFRRLRILVLQDWELDDELLTELSNCLARRRHLLGHHRPNIETLKVLNATFTGTEKHVKEVLEQIRMHVPGDLIWGCSG
ncbi:hypothetical protein H0H92_000559 [Tricholoma furcatifolium]|nr:hypothetical protein H0H92_000559 [Tricholoma furcatifolium]